MRSKLSDIFDPKEPEELKEEIKMERKEDGGKMEIKVESKGGGDNQHVPFDSNAVFNTYLGILSNDTVMDLRSNFDEVKKVKREAKVEDDEVAPASKQDEIEVVLKWAPNDSQGLAKSDIQTARIIFDDTLQARSNIINATQGTLIEQYEEGPKTEFIVKGSEAEIKMVYKGVLVPGMSKEEIKKEIQSIVNEEFTSTIFTDIKDKLYDNTDSVSATSEVGVKQGGPGQEDDGNATSFSVALLSTTGALTATVAMVILVM